jgi:Protein of unknown function (DUF2911)
MHRLTYWFVLSALLFLTASAAFAQGSTSNATATCNFDRTKQLAVEYQRVTVGVKKEVLGREIPYGRIWAPGGKPMAMFTNTTVTVGGKEVPIGAYTLFLIPDEKAWILIVSKSTDTSGKYDQQQDLVRVPMQFGELPRPEPQFSVYFAHVARNQCNMRLDLQKARAWVAFEKRK